MSNTLGKRQVHFIHPVDSSRAWCHLPEQTKNAEITTDWVRVTCWNCKRKGHPDRPRAPRTR